MIPVWLSFLPVTEDTDEAPHVYGYLCDLIDANHPLVLGQNNANLPNILALFAEVFTKEAVEKDSAVGQRMLGILTQLRSNDQLFVSVISHLSTDQQQAISTFMEAKTTES